MQQWYISINKEVEIWKTSIERIQNSIKTGYAISIKSIDWLKRNSREIKKGWKEITQVIGADIKVFDMPLLETTQYKFLIGNFFSCVELLVLTFVVEQERVNIKHWQQETCYICNVVGKIRRKVG
jgi:hypothetical protein